MRCKNCKRIIEYSHKSPEGLRYVDHERFTRPFYCDEGTSLRVSEVTQWHEPLIEHELVTEILDKYENRNGITP